MAPPVLITENVNGIGGCLTAYTHPPSGHSVIGGRRSSYRNKQPVVSLASLFFDWCLYLCKIENKFYFLITNEYSP